MRAAYYRYGCWPWKVPPAATKVNLGSSRGKDIPEAGPLGYVVAEIIRLLIGAGLAMAAVTTSQVSGPLGAIGIGVAAPTIIGQLTRLIPLSSSDTARPRTDQPAQSPPEKLPAQRPDLGLLERSPAVDTQE